MLFDSPRIYIAKSETPHLELAKSVEDRAQRLETIALERRDVAWTQTYFKETHTLSSQNVGTVTAHDVVLVVDP